MRMTESEFRDHCNNGNGYCTKCKDVTNYGGCEPDARNYECESCGQESVFGIEESLISGWIEITD